MSSFVVHGMSVGLEVDDADEMPMVLSVSATIDNRVVELTITPAQLAGLVNMAMGCDRETMVEAMIAAIRVEKAYDTTAGLLQVLTGLAVAP